MAGAVMTMDVAMADNVPTDTVMMDCVVMDYVVMDYVVMDSAMMDAATQCLESFKQCLLQASSVHPRELSMVEDQAARFTTWATSIGVLALGQTTMNHPLQYSPEVQIVVTGLLESLDYLTRTCSTTLSFAGKPTTTHAPTGPGEALDQTLEDIASEISRLHKVSNTIHRASKEPQLLEAGEFQIKDESGNNVEPDFLDDFEHYIHSRLPNVSEPIRRRLACSVLLRRKRDLYRRRCQENTAIRLQHPALKPPATPVAAHHRDLDTGEAATPMSKTETAAQSKSATPPINPAGLRVFFSNPRVFKDFNLSLAHWFALKRKFEKITE